MKIYEVKLTFTEPVLGPVPKSKEIYEKWVQDPARKQGVPEALLAEELLSVQDMAEKGWTGFHMKDGRPTIYDYAVKGFFKSACYFMRQAGGKTLSKKLPAYKKKIDGLVHVFPRLIPIMFDGDVGVLERPLRADTPKGPRVALIRSDTCPEGATMRFTVEVIGIITEALLREWLYYGRYMGLGQWRSGGFGKFKATIIAKA